MAGWGEGIVPSYDAIADEYAQQYFDELDGKPFDREWLDRFAASVKGSGRVCDLGCGPGQIARYLASRGVDAFGKRVALVATLFSEAEVRAVLEGAGVRIDAMVTRPPYEQEYQSHRIYTLATRPSSRQSRHSATPT